MVLSRRGKYSFLAFRWILTTKEARDQLTNLQAHGNKKEFLEVARNLPSYGVIQFQKAIVDYPEASTQTSVTIGNKELSTRTIVGKKVQEARFKVTRMRCWRVTTIHNVSIGQNCFNKILIFTIPRARVRRGN